jgi:hypothetical protein
MMSTADTAVLLLFAGVQFVRIVTVSFVQELANTTLLH